MRVSPVKLRILATLAYHDVLAMPLTAWEVYRWQIAANLPRADRAREQQPLVGQEVVSLAGVMQELEHLRADGSIGEMNGYYFLEGRETLYAERIERMKAAEAKWHKAQWAISCLRAAPFIRGAALAGSMGRGMAVSLSDIDLFIITEKNRIWTGRFFLTMLALLNWRLRPGRYTRLLYPFARKGPKGSYADKLCLNHYVSLTGMAMRNKNLYTAMTRTQILPLWGEQYFAEFYARNAWIFSYVPNALAATTSCKTITHGRLFAAAQRIGEAILAGFVGDIVERMMRAGQLWLIAKNPLTKKPGKVEVSDAELAFHPSLRDEEVLDNFKGKMVKWLEA